MNCTIKIHIYEYHLQSCAEWGALKLIVRDPCFPTILALTRKLSFSHWQQIPSVVCFFKLTAHFVHVGENLSAKDPSLNDP